MSLAKRPAWGRFDIKDRMYHGKSLRQPVKPSGGKRNPSGPARIKEQLDDAGIVVGASVKCRYGIFVGVKIVTKIDGSGHVYLDHEDQSTGHNSLQVIPKQ